MDRRTARSLEYLSPLTTAKLFSLFAALTVSPSVKVIPSLSVQRQARGDRASAGHDVPNFSTFKSLRMKNGARRGRRAAVARPIVVL